MVNLYKNKFRLQSTRLSSWDYSANAAYFVTICTDHKVPYFGKIEDSDLVRTEIGNYAIKSWESIPEHYPFVELDAFILMPDHFHGIVCLGKMNSSVGNPNQFGPQIQNLGSIIRSFKGAVKYFANTQNIQFHWQTRYFDRIIRNDRELIQVREYIRDNPVKWKNTAP